jgi:putative ABC transport system permease protein
MIWSIAWKNIWRNKTRSMIVVVSVILGLTGGMLLVGIMGGWVEQRIDSAIFNEISHIQIHNPDFMNNEEIHFTINDYDKIKSILDTMVGVKAFTTRSKMFAMIKSDWGTTGMVIKAIDLEREKQISKLNNFIIAGGYFSDDSKLPSIVVGSKAAEELKLLNYQIDSVKIGNLDSIGVPKEISEKIYKLSSKRFRTEKKFKDELSSVLSSGEMKNYGQKLVDYFSFYRLRAKVTITVSDSAGNMVPLTFRVQGIYKTSNSVFDAMNAFVLREPLLKETGFKDNFIHEIDIICTNNETAVIVAKKLKKLLPEHSVLSWKEISPDLGYLNDMMRVMDMFYVGIILFALAFGIINTMLMAVLERSKELGMLMAVGMNKLRVFIMIMLESVFLTLTGAIAGMVISGIILAILSKTGLNLSMWSEGLEAIGYSAIVYPVITITNYTDITILVILTGVIASLWPARKALAMNPAESLRTE